MKRLFYLFLFISVLFINLTANNSWAGGCSEAQELSREASLYLSSNPDMAEKKLREAIRLCNKSAALRYNLAMVLYHKGEYKEAEADLENTLRLNPDFSMALNALAFIYLSKDSGDRTRAMELAKRAVELDPGNKEYRDTLAKAKVPKYPPVLSMEVSIKEQNGNGVIEASEPATLKVKLTNTGKGEARMVKVIPELEESVSGLKIDSGITVPGIAPDSEKTLEFIIQTNEENLPTDILSIVVNAIEMNGFDADPVKITIATRAYDSPVLQVADIGINDQSENGQIEPAEIVEITARIQNTGTGNARGVKAKLHLGKEVFLAGDSHTEFDLANIPSGQYKDIVFTIYTSRNATGIPVSLSITEERPKHNREYPLDLAFNRQEKKRPREIVVAPTAMGATLALSIDVDIPPKTGADSPDAVAVIIGNKTYKNKLVPSVEYAVRDAAVMKQYLIDTMGFKEHNIIYLQNAEKADLQKTFGDENDHRGDLYSRIRKGLSDVFIYYSGHGAPNPNTKRAYLVPANADPNSIKFTGYSLDTMYENLLKLSKDKEVKSMTVVFEACFSGASNSGMIIQDASPIYIDVEIPILLMENAVVFASSRGDQISSWYREKRHGLFTYFFLKAIKDAVKDGRKVTAGSIEAAVLDVDSVNDFAWRLYKRKQQPSIMGNKDIVLVEKGSQTPIKN